MERKLLQKENLVKELQEELAKAGNNQQILEKSILQKDKHIAILVKDKSSKDKNDSKSKEDALAES